MTLSEWIKELQAVAEEKGGDLEVRGDETNGDPYFYLKSDVNPTAEHEILYIG